MRPLNDMRLPGNFDEALQLLNGRLALDGAPPYNLVVCGGYHADDLHMLAPTDDELLEAARWVKTHDPSDGFLQGLKWFLEEFGYGHLVPRI